ncbi:two-component sensor histidine kinase BarA [Vibrio sp. HA2012]|uniref:two-component sensor histidine kinase BarA n=1 Tax=Vibrio sp. HA2012 TaxID=1971595 RepID=UPI000C2C5F54|nr:two-component sensor histidine kinase BarA [Vibrio sp. HA2012]PJC86338.1 two-component sensor histidine kinase BarA [Vibrio sp. HA2012]
MTKYGLRARVITLTLAPTLIIGLLLSSFFTFNRYHDLEHQLIDSGTSILEPLAIASEYGMLSQSHDAVRRLIGYAHRKNSDIIRSIAVFDAKHQLFVTSNFHPNFESLTLPKDKPIPLLSHVEMLGNRLILHAPILAEGQFDMENGLRTDMTRVLGYIAMELDTSPLRLQQYQEMFAALIVLIFGLALAGLFSYRLMQEVTQPITNMKRTVDKIRRGHLDSRIEGKMHGELDTLKSGINAMAMSLSEYHMEMQNSIDQATSDLRETLEQLEIQNVELDLAKKRAQEAARIKSEFLANMSHELRTPLNGVIGFARQMLKTTLTSSQVDYLQTIERSANNLLNIINDILDFSKLEAGKLLLENIPFEFQENLEEVVSLLAPSAHEKGLELTLKVDSRIPPGLVGDPLRIQQILTNLVGNSIKFTERGNIDITVELKDQHNDSAELQFMIRDTGIGISERQQTQLFQAFRQADASISRRYGGTGLGLVIARKLVGQMGGEISLTSRLHQGSTFWFTLHLATTDLPLSQPIDKQYLKDKRLLLIEPNMQAASVIQQMLGQEGVQVTYQTSVPEQSRPQDSVLLNLSPKQACDPATIAGWIGTIRQYTGQIIIGLPSTELALSEQLLKAFPVQCLTKPISRRKLLMTLTRHQQVSALLPLAEPVSDEEKLPLKVMAVDDNPANLKLISALLKERVEQVVSCSSGEKAVEEAGKQKFDIVLMDIQMPHMDGVQACQHIKAIPLNQDTPVIAVTAHAMSGERDRLLNAGMDDYLTKPIEEHILQQVLVHWNPATDARQVEKLVLTGEPSETPAHNGHIIDWQKALKQAANKESLAREMLDMLVSYIGEVSRVVDLAIADKEYSINTLLHHIHKLHGSCSYSGVPGLKKVCATIEKNLRSGMSIEETEPELFELQDEMTKVVQAAGEYLSEKDT